MITQELQDLEKAIETIEKLLVFVVNRRWRAPGRAGPLLCVISPLSLEKIVELSTYLVVALSFERDSICSRLACQLEAAVALFQGRSIALVVHRPDLFLARCHDRTPDIRQKFATSRRQV